jgi:hypothetical protein
MEGDNGGLMLVSKRRSQLSVFVYRPCTKKTPIDGFWRFERFLFNRLKLSNRTEERLMFKMFKMFKKSTDTTPASTKVGRASGGIMTCDICSGQLASNEGYAFFCDVCSRPGLPIGNMLLCEACTERIMSDRSFAAAREHPPVITSTSDLRLRQELNCESIVARCKRLGLSPEQAKQKARELALEFCRNKERGAELTIQFWTSEPPKAPSHSSCSTKAKTQAEELAEWNNESNRLLAELIAKHSGK